MLAWFAFFMLLAGAVIYGLLSPDFFNSNAQNMPYARAAIMPLVARHQGATKLITMNLPAAKAQLALTDTQFTSEEFWAKNLFTTPTENTASVGVISAQKMKDVMPNGLEDFASSTTLGLPNYRTYNSIFACLDDMGQITTTCDKNKAYVLTYGYQQDWWDERATRNKLWQNALYQETNGKMCGVLSCTDVSCQIKNGGVPLVPFPDALYKLLINDALVNTGGKYPLVGLTVCLTQVSVGPDNSTPPVYGDGTSEVGDRCLSDADCTTPGKTYCNPATFQCEALATAEECVAVNPQKPYHVDGVGCVECTGDSHCPEICDTDGVYACKTCAQKTPATPVYNSATSTCVGCLSDSHCPADKPVCYHSTCTTCSSIDETIPYYVSGRGCVACKPTTQDIDCPPATQAGIQCPANAPYYHTGIGCLACASDTCTSFKDANGRVWVASNQPLSVANSKSFCNSVGGVALTTRDPMCGGASEADCQSSSIYASLRSYFYVNGVDHGGVQRTTIWTSDDNTPTAGNYWYVNLSTTTMGYTAQGTKYYALCTGIITPPMICDTTTYACRTPSNDTECATYTPATPVYNSATGLCEDCSGDTPVNDNGTCRAPNTDAECAQFYPTEPRYAPGVGCVVCTPATQGDDCVATPPSPTCDPDVCAAFEDSRGVHWKISPTNLTQYESVNFCRNLGGHLPTEAEISPVLVSELAPPFYKDSGIPPRGPPNRDYAWLAEIKASDPTRGYYLKLKNAQKVEAARNVSMNSKWGMYAFCIVDGASSVCDTTDYTCRPAHNTAECAATMVNTPIYNSTNGQCRGAQSDSECVALNIGRPHMLNGACVECLENSECPEACDTDGDHMCKTCYEVSADYPIYDSTSGTCIQCTNNNHCTGDKPICDTDTHLCRAGDATPTPCTADGDCPSGQVCHSGICTLSCRTQSDPDGYCQTMFGPDWACDLSSSSNIGLVGGHCRYCLYTYDGQVQDLRDIRLATSTGVTPDRFSTTGQAVYYWYNANGTTSYKNACLVNVTTANTDCPSVKPDLCGDEYVWMPYSQLPININISDNLGASTWRACTKTKNSNGVLTANGKAGMFATTGTNPVYMTKVDTSGWLIHRDSVYSYPLGMVYYALCTPACWNGTQSSATPTCYKMTHTWGPLPASDADCKNIAPSLTYDDATGTCVNAPDLAKQCRTQGKVYDENATDCRNPEDATDCAWIDGLKPVYASGTCIDACGATCPAGAVCEAATGQCTLTQVPVECEKADDCPAGYTCAGHLCSLYCFNKGSNKTKRDEYCQGMMGTDWACDTNSSYGGYCQPCVVSYDGGTVDMRDFKYASSTTGTGVNANAGTTADATLWKHADPNNKAESACLYGAYIKGVSTSANYNNAMYTVNRDTDCPVVQPGLCGPAYEWVGLNFLKTLNPDQDYGNDFQGFAARMRACTITAAGGSSLPAAGWTRVRQDYAYGKYVNTNGLVTTGADSSNSYRVLCMPACYKNTQDATHPYCYKATHTWGPQPTSTADCTAADPQTGYYDNGTCRAPENDNECRAVNGSSLPYYVAGRGCVACTPETQDTDCATGQVCDQMIYECAGCTNTYDADGIATGDTCPANQYCFRVNNNDGLYNYGDAWACDKRQPALGTCANLPLYDTAVINGDTWVASRTGMRWWSAMSFCAKIGAKPVTRAEICDGGTTTAECLNSATWQELHRVFNTEAKAIYGNSSTLRTYCWTKEDYPSYSCYAYYVNLSTGTVNNYARPNSTYALCKY